MNIENMRAFLEITSAGSFQAGAERLHITQSAISARIISLEDRLNQKLFHRKRSGVELTESGSRFLRHAQNCVQSWERAQQEIALPQSYDNLFSLGIQLNFWDRVTTPWTQWMEQHAPQYATRIFADYSEKLLSLVRDGMLDLSLVYNVRKNNHLDIKLFNEEKLILVSTVKRKLNTGWTPGYVFVDWSEDFLAEHTTAFADSPTPCLSIGSGAVALAHILKQGGSGYFIETEVCHLIDSQQLFIVDDAPEFSRKSFLVSQKNSSIKPSIDIAVQGLHSILG
jgi:DNA-binding transcriptional LysR family regulator